MKKIYILGAGFSRDARLPLISDFHDEEFQDNLAESIKKRKDNLKRFHQATHILNFLYDNYIVSDIEDALGHLSCAKYLDVEIDIDKVKSTFPETHIRDLEWLIVQAVSLKGKRIPKFYKKFFSKVIKEKSTILYFNYDLLPERVAKRHGKEFDYGFLDEYSAIRGKLPLLLKLHGSADWLFCDNCGLQISYGQEVAIKIANNTMKCPKCNRTHGLSPVIIPPIVGKEDIIIKYGRGKRNIRDVWALAVDELSEADKIIFIGYSLSNTDVYARNLFKIAEEMAKKSTRYLIINPDSDVMNNYRAVLPHAKLTHQPHGFQEVFLHSPRLL